MQTKTAETTHFLVAAWKAETENIASHLYEALRDAGAGFDASGHKTLSDKGPVHACEFHFSAASPENVRSALSNLPADIAILPASNRKKHLLICDMDSTIISEECLDELADFAGLKAEISAITERAMAGELNFEEALTTRVAMLEGLALDAITQCYDERINLNPGAKTLVATMKANGAHCLLVSGGFTAFTARVAQAAGFHGHHANTLIDDGKVLTGKVAMPILGRAAKLERLNAAAGKHGLTAQDALAMGDGANDLAMIKAAGLGLAYRAKPIVAKEAHAAIRFTDLTTALFFQGYSFDEFIRE